MDMNAYLAGIDMESVQSFPGAVPPGEEVGRIERDGETYIYYEAKDENGSKQIYYATESGLAFARKMQAAIWRQKKKDLTL